MYFVNITCEEPTSGLNCSYLTSSWGCIVNSTYLQLRYNDNNNETQIYDAAYVGDSIQYGGLRENLADFCPNNASDSFMVQFSKALVPVQAFNEMNQTEQCANAQLTFLFCRPSYWQQDVYATISSPDNAVLGVETIGTASTIPSDMFNETVFEENVAAGQQPLLSRADFPERYWPNQAPYLSNMPLNVDPQSKMAAFAVSSFQRPIDDYFDPDTLRLSYQSAYQLLFARQQVPYFNTQLNQTTQNTGRVSFQTQGIVVVPAFAYAAEAVLGATICFAVILLSLEIRSRVNLSSDPSTIAALMSLSANEPDSLQVFKDLDRVSQAKLSATLSLQSFRFRSSNSRPDSVTLIAGEQEPLEEDQVPLSPLSHGDLAVVRPIEFGVGVGIAFLCVLATLMAVLAVLQVKITSLNGNRPTYHQFSLCCLADIGYRSTTTITKRCDTTHRRELHSHRFRNNFGSIMDHAKPNAWDTPAL